MAHTFRHDAAMPLERTWGVLSAAHRSMSSGGTAKRERERYGILGHVKAQEVTVGRNGWHPHGHSLWFMERPMRPSDVKALNEGLFKRFSRGVEREGFAAPLSTYNRMETVRDAGGLAYYVAKVANELARFDGKQGRGEGRTPFQVLMDFERTGDCDDLELWRQWEVGSRQRESLRWSRGLKSHFNVGEVTDDEIVSETVEGQEVERFTFTDEQWARVCRIPGAQPLLMRCIETGGADAVAMALDALAVEAGQVGLLA